MTTARDFVRPLTVNDDQGWSGIITLKDGRIINMSDVAKIDSFQERLGVAHSYGVRPEGYDGHVLKEKGGGGSISVAYFFNGRRSRKNLFVAALREQRNGREVLNLPRAFLKPGQQHLTLAEQTAKEEFGLNVPFKTTPLGNPVNSNSAFFLNDKDEGCRFFSTLIDKRALELIPVNGHFKFKNEVIPIDPKDTAGKRLVASVFMPAHLILKDADMDDMFTPAGIGLLKEALWPIN